MEKSIKTDNFYITQDSKKSYRRLEISFYCDGKGKNLFFDFQKAIIGDEAQGIFE